MSGNNVSLSESPIKVIRETNFVEVTNKENSVANKKIVDELIANCSCWQEEDRETLNGLEDSKVEKLLEASKASKKATLIANKAIEGFEDEDGGMHAFNLKTGDWEHAPKKEDEPVGNNEVKEQPDEEWLNSAPAGIRAVVQNAMDIDAKKRKELCEKIVSNGI